MPVEHTVPARDPQTLDGLIRRMTPGRTIDGLVPALMPFHANDQPDLDGYARVVERIYDAGLTPAVNMATGYVDVLTTDQRRDVLAVAAGVARGRRFIAAAFIEGERGDTIALYRREIERILRQGGTPLLFQCTALTALDDEGIAEVYRVATSGCPAALAFELAKPFAPFGRIYSFDLIQRLMDIPTLAGLMHSSRDRVQEWYRLDARDVRRPEFRIYTGNDLAIDMVYYGSDYALGLATFAPDAFALRDRLWRAGDARVHAVNDLLQYLGFLAFRPPMPAYKHAAAQFLHLRGHLRNARPHSQGARRPDSDLILLQDIVDRLDALVHVHQHAAYA